MTLPNPTVAIKPPKRPVGRPPKYAPKVIKPPKKTRAERSAINRENGKRKAGRVSIATLQKELIREHVDQRLMRATDGMVNAQISLARGQQFLYRIKKTYVQTGKTKEGEPIGYYKNEKPELVTTQWEIEAYLEELADNNGELSDDKDESDTYYFITTKEPNMLAIKDGLDRVHGKPKETQEVNVHNTFSLIGLAQKRAMLDGNKDVTIIDDPMLPPETVK